ncbi:MAG: virulence factor SrfB [Haliscomenobacter sp.]|nr:virulence factor SrfB [Haliscomenobacter sp.]
MMTFAFLEILAQANMQINSYEQRNHWGTNLYREKSDE